MQLEDLKDIKINTMKENKIPSAESILDSKFNESFTDQWVYNNITDAMVEFAKLHVKAALEAAYNNASLKEEEFEIDEQICWNSSEMGDCYVLDKNSILSAYPEELIK